MKVVEHIRRKARVEAIHVFKNMQREKREKKEKTKRLAIYYWVVCLHTLSVAFCRRWCFPLPFLLLRLPPRPKVLFFFFLIPSRPRLARLLHSVYYNIKHIHTLAQISTRREK
jgi:hypothetical protein